MADLHRPTSQNQVQIQDDHVLQVIGVVFTPKGLTVAFQVC